MTYNETNQEKYGISDGGDPLISEWYYKKIRSKFRTFKESDIKPGDKVFIHESCVYPRRLFKEFFPDNKLVRSPKNADHLVINMEKYLYVNSYLRTDKVNMIGSNVASCDELPKKPWRFVSRDDKEIYELYMSFKDGINISDISSLLKGKDGSVKVTSELKKMITDLLSGDVEGNIDMALVLLSSINFDKNKVFIAETLRSFSYTRTRLYDTRVKRASVKEQFFINNLKAALPHLYDYDFNGTICHYENLSNYSKKYEKRFFSKLYDAFPVLKNYEIKKKDNVTNTI